jgi:hypothetical protein
MSRRNTRSRAEEGADKLAVAVRRRLRVRRLIGAVAATWWLVFTDRALGVCPFAGCAGKIVVHAFGDLYVCRACFLAARAGVL